MIEMGNGIFSEHRHIQTGNNMIQTMIDLRINMIGPTSQNNTFFARFLLDRQWFLPFFLHIPTEGFFLSNGSIHGLR